MSTQKNYSRKITKMTIHTGVIPTELMRICSIRGARLQIGNSIIRNWGVNLTGLYTLL